MNQPVQGDWGLRKGLWRAVPTLLMVLLSVALGGCRREAGVRGKHPTVASVAPSATDLIVAMGAGEHLVAISNFDVERAQTKGLARVGDYRTLDWEKMDAIRPDVLVFFAQDERVQAGLRQRAQERGIRLLNLRTERLSDIYEAIAELGDAMGEKAKAAEENRRLHEQIAAVERRVSGERRVPTLIVRESSVSGVVGRENFIDDALRVAGGENVITQVGWPNLDGEQLRALRPEVVIVLLPDGSPQQAQQAERVLKEMPMLPAVAKGRIYVMRQWWVQQSGSHVGELAEEFAKVLHPAGGGRP